MSTPPPSTDSKRILIVGGVAGGASCAARARRLDEHARIAVFERGPYVSFANCGLPYYVGDVITQEENLLIATPELFRERFAIDVFVNSEVRAIDRERREIEVVDLSTGQVRREPYDALVLSPGAEALRPPLPGIDLPGIHVLRTIPDSREIRAAIEGAHKAVVVGAGFIGLEMAENLRHRKLEVHLVELLDQVMPPLDPEMASYVSQRLKDNGVVLHLGGGVESFEERAGGGLVVRTSKGEALDADIVILAIGVRPQTELATAADLDLGERGGIAVDEEMRTCDPAIWAVGDAVETRDALTGGPCLLPLAGPANRQGRVAAASILGRGGEARRATGSDAVFRGVQGTAVCGVFGLAVASTGASEKALQRAGITAYEKVWLHPNDHVGYYPGAKEIHLKLLFSTEDGRVLGAQAVGEAGAARRIDVIATHIQLGATVFDLEEAELCYAPQYGAAKDPINLAGMIAANHLRGDHPLADWSDLGADGILCVDVRTEEEFAKGHAPHCSVNIPVEKLRGRLDELPTDGPIRVNCGVGQRSYYATRLLLQRGYDVANFSGGLKTWMALKAGGVLKR